MNKRSMLNQSTIIWRVRRIRLDFLQYLQNFSKPTCPSHFTSKLSRRGMVALQDPSNTRRLKSKSKLRRLWGLPLKFHETFTADLYQWLSLMMPQFWHNRLCTRQVSQGWLTILEGPKSLQLLKTELYLFSRRQLFKTNSTCVRYRVTMEQFRL